MFDDKQIRIMLQCSDFPGYYNELIRCWDVVHFNSLNNVELQSLFQEYSYD